MKSRIVHGQLPVYRSSVAQAPTKRAHYADGINPYGMTTKPTRGTLGVQDNVHPDLRATSKADEVARADRTIGDVARGVLTK